jgi:energy-coupling factor transport system permease protein
LRFVPTFFEEIEKIGRAQRTRGADFRSGSPAQRIRGLVPLFIPLLVSAFRHAEELATAMEARGFRGARRRSRLVQLRLGRHDLAATLTMLAASLAILAVGR